MWLDETESSIWISHSDLEEINMTNFKATPASHLSTLVSHQEKSDLALNYNAIETKTLHVLEITLSRLHTSKMPVVSGGTPESILPRSDSRNPATTCKGLTSNGRPCRRSLASSKNGNQGILAVLPHVGHVHESAAAYYCWQHKDQASRLVDESGQIIDLKQRSSIDTLMDKLGVLEIEDKQTRSRTSISAAMKRDSLPPQWAAVPGPLISVPEHPVVSAGQSTPALKPRPKRRRKEQIHFSFFCCMQTPSDEKLPAPKPRPAPAPAPAPTSNTVSLPHRSLLQAMPNSLESHISFIPQSLAPTIRTSLMSELSKPLTATDHEPGYIYIFWLTPKDVPQDAVRAASSLFVPSDRISAPRTGRRASDVLMDFNYDNDMSESSKSRTIMLKIGRASNVHRRMIQWSQQCGQHITLLRYYPHHDKKSSPAPSPKVHSRASPKTTSPAKDTIPAPLQKAPFIPRVERLIHLELADQQVRRSCEGCGKEHREWFEVDATRQGIREVDAVVRKWILWAQQRSS